MQEKSQKVVSWSRSQAHAKGTRPFERRTETSEKKNAKFIETSALVTAVFKMFFFLAGCGHNTHSSAIINGRGVFRGTKSVTFDR